MTGEFETLRDSKLSAAHVLGEWQTRKAGLNAELYRTIAVARGELDVPVPQGDDDEVGRLLRSLGSTVQRLGQSLEIIRSPSESMHEMTGKLSHSVDETRHMHGLAQQSAAASQSLKAQSSRLHDVLGAFRLPSHSAV